MKKNTQILFAVLLLSNCSRTYSVLICKLAKLIPLIHINCSGNSSKKIKMCFAGNQNCLKFFSKQSFRERDREKDVTLVSKYILIYDFNIYMNFSWFSRHKVYV